MVAAGCGMDDLQVECGEDAGGRSVPRRFGWRGATREVVEVIDRWPGEGHRYFRVRDDTGAVLVLRHDLERDAWQLHAFEASGGS